MKQFYLIKATIVALFLLPLTAPECLHAAPVSIVNVQYGPYADVYVNQRYPATNFDGSRPNFAVRSYADATGSLNIRALVAFDLTNIPPGSYVTYAKLFLYMYDAPDATRTYECDRIVSRWGESTVTWGDQPNVEGLGPRTTTIGTIPDVWVSWDVKTWVQSFVLGEISATPNYGWMIRDKNEDSTTLYESVFYSQESDTDLHPTLTMSYYPPHLELETYGSGFTAGNWVKMTVHRRDYNNVTVNRGDLNVKLSSTSASANKRFSTSQGGAPINEINIGNGSSSKDFWYYDDKVATCTIRVWTGDYLYYGDDSEEQVIQPGALDHFAFAHLTPLETVAVPFSTTITAFDAYGNIVTGYTGTNALSDTTGTISPTVTGAFVNGVWSGNVVINKVADNVKIATSGAGKTGESNPFDVIAGPPAKISIFPVSFTMAAGIQYSSLTVELRDANGFVTKAITPIIVNLASTSADGEFRQVGGTAKVTSVTVPMGSGSFSIDYYDIRGGTWALTASATGLNPGTSVATVIPDTMPPVTAITVGPPKYPSGAALYVFGNTTFTLSATDEASGVKETMYRVDSGNWNAYVGPFTLSAYPDGSHAIGYYSIDRANNSEAEKALTASLDKTPPEIQVLEPSGSIIARSGSVAFRATVEDEGSGIAGVELLLDGTSQGAMEYLNATYAKTEDVASGTHTWRVRAADNLGSIAETSDVGFSLAIDNEPPTISNVAMSPISPAMGDVVRITATIEDAIAGVQGAVLVYSTNGGSSWERVVMISPIPPGISYEGTIPAQGPMANVQFYIEASDALGNAASSTIQEYAVAIPLWVYGAIVVVLIAVVIFIMRGRGRQPPILPPPPPPPPELK